MTSTRTKRGVAKLVMGLWVVGGLMSIPSAAWATHQCDAIEIRHYCPFTGGTASACIGDPHGESHPCIWGNE